jgi:hypothetical protein
MCSGGNRKAKEREARKKGKKQRQEAKARQRELDRIAQERKILARRQVRRQEELEAEQVAFIEANDAKVAELNAQQDQRLATLAADDQAARSAIKQETARKVAGIERAGGAAATSLRILGQKQPKAPQAVQTPRNNKRRGAGSTSASVARGTGSTRGTNLSI